MSGTFNFINYLETMASSVKVKIGKEPTEELELFLGNDFTQKFLSFLENNVSDVDFILVESAYSKSTETEPYLKMLETNERLAPISNIEEITDKFLTQYIDNINTNSILERFYGEKVPEINQNSETKKVHTFSIHDDEDIIQDTAKLSDEYFASLGIGVSTKPEQTQNTEVVPTTVKDIEVKQEIPTIPSIIEDEKLVEKQEPVHVKEEVVPEITVKESVVESSPTYVEIVQPIITMPISSEEITTLDEEIPTNTNKPLSEPVQTIQSQPIIEISTNPVTKNPSLAEKLPTINIAKLLSIILDKRIMGIGMIILCIVGYYFYKINGGGNVVGTTGTGSTTQSITEQINSTAFPKVNIATEKGSSTIEYMQFRSDIKRDPISDSKRTIYTKTIDELFNSLKADGLKLQSNKQNLAIFLNMQIRILSINGNKTLTDISVHDFLSQRKK